MQSLDLLVIQQAREWIEKEPVWLCTVLSTYGSSPRSPGALLAASASHGHCGSLSGGCVEEDFLCRIRDGQYREGSQVIRYGDGGLIPDRALPCGGGLDILIEYLLPDDRSLAYLEALGRAMETGKAVVKSLRIPDRCYSLTPSDYRSTTQVDYENGAIRMTVASPPRIIIAGLSAVAIYCADFAVSLGFETIVCENRPDVLRSFVGSLSPGVLLREVFPANFLEKEGGLHANTAVVALTHDPRMDDLTLMEGVRTEAFYLGAMGSARNSANRLARLKKTGGLSDDDIRRIRAPVGMQIGSKTPAEIALAVMADIVLVKNRLTGKQEERGSALFLDGIR